MEIPKQKKRTISGHVGLTVGILVSGVALPVLAQMTAAGSGRSVGVERFRLSSDRAGVLDVEWGWTPRAGTWTASLWGSYADDLLVVRDASSDQRVGSVVHQRIGGSASFAYSLTDRFQISAGLPLVFWQVGEQAIPGLSGASPGAIDSFGLGSVRLTPKVGLFRSLDQRASVALLAHVLFPSIHKNGYFGDRGVGIQPELATSMMVGRFRVAANVNYLWRSSAPVLLGVAIHDQLGARAGVGYRFGVPRSDAQRPFEVDLTVAGATAANAPFDQSIQNAAGIAAALQYDLPSPVTLFTGGGVGLLPAYGVPDFHVLAGVRLGSRSAAPRVVPVVADLDPDGDGVPSSSDRCPRVPEDRDGFEDADGCPDADDDHDGVMDADDSCRSKAGAIENKGCPDKDSDGDGVVDRLDRCPAAPEDPDRFEDADGCVDPDNDHDDILDAEDACPLEAGTVEGKGCPARDRDSDGVADSQDNCPDEAGDKLNHGCQAKQWARITETGIEISDTVYFKVNRGIIQRKSFPLLENVAQVIRNHPETGNIRIEGHTDSRGDDTHNQMLSEKRAQAVLEFLAGKGIPRERLTARGLGEAQPMGDNRTTDGRRQNRRVVFIREPLAPTPPAAP